MQKKKYLDPAFTEGFIGMTLSDKSKSQHQKYRLTSKGIALKDRLLIHQSAQKTVSEEITTSASGEVTGEATGEATEVLIEEVRRVIIALNGEMK